LNLSFDCLVSLGEDQGRHGEAEGLRGLQIDRQLEFGRLLDWQIGRLLSIEDASGVNAGLAFQVGEDGEARSVADQAEAVGDTRRAE
jgi:hypothetical protein